VQRTDRLFVWWSSEMTGEHAVHAEAVGPSGAFDTEEISLFDIGSVVLIHRWRLVRYALVGAILAVLPVFFRPPEWTASASFIAETEDVQNNQGGLRRLAGQFGMMAPTSGSFLQLPEFYIELLSSRTLLSRLLADTVTVGEEQPARHKVADLFGFGDRAAGVHDEDALRELRSRMKVTASTVGILTLTVTTEWPAVSAEIANRAIEEVNRFSLHAGQTRASEERRFIDARMAAQQQSLAAAEARLEEFLRANRQFVNSPRLIFEHDRLQREVALQQQVLIELAQAFEQTRLREVRDVRTITVIDAATPPSRPDPRRRAVRAGFGGAAGLLLGVFVAFLRELTRSRQALEDPRAQRFFELLHSAGGMRSRKPSKTLPSGM
jgi:uncharacterized protein involved in exopolysaccharide biosynthesis